MRTRIMRRPFIYRTVFYLPSSLLGKHHRRVIFFQSKTSTFLLLTTLFHLYKSIGYRTSNISFKKLSKNDQ